MSLFLATAGVVLWQNAHVAVLFDLSYILNTAARIALGQMPYRDFPLAHAPLTFLIQAAIIRLTGRVIFHHVLYTALIGGLGTVLAWRIALGSLRGRVAAAWPIALLVAAPLCVLGIYCIVPNPEYDCDCGFWILVAVWMWMRVDVKTSATFGFAAGAVLCVPVFFKQNMGLPLLVAALAAVVTLICVELFRGKEAGLDAAGEGNHEKPEEPTSGAKAHVNIASYAARLKSWPKNKQTYISANKATSKGFYGLPLIGQKTSDEWGTVSSPVGWHSRWMTDTKSPSDSGAKAHVDFKGSLPGLKSRPTARTGYTAACSTGPEISTLLGVVGGVCATLAAAVLALHWTAGVGNYLHWTIEYAGQRRMPGFGLMLDVYHDPLLLWTLPCVVAALVLLRAGSKLPWTRFAAFALMAVPFLLTLASLFLYDDADERGDALLALWPLLLVLASALAITNLFRLRGKPSLRAFLPLVLLAAIHGTFMSQQLWGSAYAIWPLLAVLVAELLAVLEGFKDAFAVRAPSPWLVPALAALISVTLLVCGGFYTASEERLSYANLPDGPPVHSAFPQLAGLATPGPYLPEIDELLRYAQANIPFDDGIVLLPGEEPFTFATGRVPKFPVPFFDPTIDPYSPAEIVSLARSRDIRWLIVKRDVQTKEDPTPQREALLNELMKEFTLSARLQGYDVYRR